MGLASAPTGGGGAEDGDDGDDHDDMYGDDDDTYDGDDLPSCHPCYGAGTTPTLAVSVAYTPALLTMPLIHTAVPGCLPALTYLSACDLPACDML